jgi:competence protein ComEC
MVEQAARQGERWTLWTPVALGSGCALYFSLLREPQLWVAWVFVGVVVALLAATRRSGVRWLTMALVLAACVVGGFAVAKLRTQAVKAPVAAAGAPPQPMEGWVVDVASPGEGGQRLLIAPIRIGDWPAEATPIRARVTLRPGTPLPAPGRGGAAAGDPEPAAAAREPRRPTTYAPRRLVREHRRGGPGAAAAGGGNAEAPAPWRLRLTMRSTPALGADAEDRGGARPRNRRPGGGHDHGP